MGPNVIISKGFKVAAAATNVLFGRFCKFNAADTGDVVTTSAIPAVPAVSADYIVGVYMETIDAVKIATGKATIGVHIAGIARVIAGAAIAKGDRLSSDATGRAVPITAGTGNNWCAGVAWTAAAAAGDVIDVYLTPGVTTNLGAT